MLAKTSRLTKKNDFDVVFNGGKTLRGDFLIVKIKESSLLQNRFGFIVSKKISTKSTVRNKVKRRLRDAVVMYGKTQKSMDVVLVALKGIEKQDFMQIQTTVNNLFKKYV